MARVQAAKGRAAGREADLHWALREQDRPGTYSYSREGMQGFWTH